MPKTTRGWPEKRRKAQSEKIRQTKPWEKATGPRTKEGKSRSSRNALTHGMSGEAGKALRALLREHRKLIAVMEMENAPPQCYKDPLRNL